MDVVPYSALGSGGLAATGVLEARYPTDGKLRLEEAIDLVKDAIRAGISNDLGSGSQVDLCVIRKEGVQYNRAVVREETLIETKEDIALDTMLRERHVGPGRNGGMGVDETIINGVNGFGSLPYFVKSKCVVAESEEIIKQDGQQWFESILGKMA